MSPHEKGISFQANERAFSALIDKVLRKQGDHLAQELDRFLWSGWCGTGSDSLSQPQSLAFFMALLNENRIAEAVGAAVNLQSENPIVTRDGKVDARIAFLKKCGLDWETILAGAALESELSGRGFLRDSPYLPELAIFGSERAAGLLLEMARRSKPDMRETYVRALAAFIPGNTDNVHVGNSSDLRRQSAAPISDETKTRVLALLEEFATPDAPADVVEPALVAFARAKAPSTKPTLRALLRHPAPERLGTCRANSAHSRRNCRIAKTGTGALSGLDQWRAAAEGDGGLVGGHAWEHRKHLQLSGRR